MTAPPPPAVPMAPASDSRIAPDVADPTAAGRGREGLRRRVLGWAIVAIILVVVGSAGFLLGGLGEWAQRDALDPDSPGPAGTRALAEVLRSQGVEVVVARDRDAARTALEDGPATLALPDAPALSDEAVSEILDPAEDVVLLDPSSRMLDLILPGAAPAGFGTGAEVEPACEASEAERSGALAPGALFTADATAGGTSEADDDVSACYPVDGAYGLLVAPWNEGVAAAVDGRSIFANEHLAEAGNAALALNLLGRHGTVVWYVPSFADTDLSDATPTLGDLTPRWVTPAIVLLALAGVVAGIWRGRRFGPLVTERLPVTVRVAETTEGRARLYARSRDTVHAADQLRIGSLDRLRRMLSLGASASAAEIADAAAERVRADRGLVRGILVDDLPATDTQLVALSDRLRDLEIAVETAVHPGRNRP